MNTDKLKGHLSTAAAYTIFGLNLVFCKDIANSGTIAPHALFALRAVGASALFSMLLSLPFAAKELIQTDYAAIPLNVRWEIGYLIFFATFAAYFLIPYGQRFIRPTLVSLYSYVQPIIAVAVSIWAGMDTLTWQKILASSLVVAGVVLVSSSRSAFRDN